MVVLEGLSREKVTDLSFHLTAFFDRVAISKLLLNPPCPTSWQRPLKTRVKISRSERMLATLGSLERR